MTETLTLVISYDISDARRRRRVDRLLRQCGVRVLESVFECRVPADRLERLRAALQRQVRDPDDGIRLYRLCADCRHPLAVLGAMREEPAGPAVVV